MKIPFILLAGAIFAGLAIGFLSSDDGYKKLVNFQFNLAGSFFFLGAIFCSLHMSLDEVYDFMQSGWTIWTIEFIFSLTSCLLVRMADTRHENKLLRNVFISG